MKNPRFRFHGEMRAALFCAAAALALVTAGAATQADTVTSPTTVGPASATGTEADAAPPSVTPTDSHGADWDADDHDEDAAHGTADDHDRHASKKHHRSADKHGDEVVNIFADSLLEAGREADSVVSVFGNSRDEGTVAEDVVSVFGDTHVDGKVGGDAVAVFGNVELGPNAQIDGDVVTVFGTLRRDPAAIVHGDSRSVFAHDFSAPKGLRSWIEHCLQYGRPLSLTPGLGWAWGLALSLLALYLCLAVLFQSGVERCVATFEQHPGESVLAALLAGLLTPVLIVLLCITVVGIAAVPFTVIGLFGVALFGKAVILAWLGGRVLRLRAGASPGAAGVPHPALAVLIGGLIALALYLVPFFGFVLYKLLGFLGFGAVVYTAIVGLRARRAAGNDGAGAGPAAAAGATIGAGATASPGATPETQPGGDAPAPLSSATAAVLPRAGFWIRMIALLLDVLLVGLVTHLLHTSSNAYLVLLGAYGGVMWKLRGSTVGGIVFDLRVVRLDGREMDWETSIIRALSCFLSLAVAGLGFFWIAFDPANQAWHDKIAGTVVVRVPKAVHAT
jgi:uncharacterized RDD family membrane protein YckC